MSDKHEHEPIETDIIDSNPNAAGPRGLEGDMGLSSERTGPVPDEQSATAPDADSVEGTGSHKSSIGSTDGKSPVDPSGHRADPAAIDNVETNPDEVANKHQFDRDRNPGH